MVESRWLSVKCISHVAPLTCPFSTTTPPPATTASSSLNSPSPHRAFRLLYNMSSQSHLSSLLLLAIIGSIIYILVAMFSLQNLRRMIPFLPAQAQVHGAMPDLLTADAKTLAAELARGSLSSVDLVEGSLAMIQKHDGYLRAMLSMVPTDQLKQTAENLDRERKMGKLRGPLHGIPIVIKVRPASHNHVAQSPFLTLARITLELIPTSEWKRQPDHGL